MHHVVEEMVQRIFDVALLIRKANTQRHVEVENALSTCRIGSPSTRGDVESCG